MSIISLFSFFLILTREENRRYAAVPFRNNPDFPILSEGMVIGSHDPSLTASHGFILLAHVAPIAVHISPEARRHKLSESRIRLYVLVNAFGGDQTAQLKFQHGASPFLARLFHEATAVLSEFHFFDNRPQQDLAEHLGV
jgi:hypothetical protein